MSKLRHPKSRRHSLGHHLSIEKCCDVLQSQPSQEWAKRALDPLILSFFQRTLTCALYGETCFSYCYSDNLTRARCQWLIDASFIFSGSSFSFIRKAGGGEVLTRRVFGSIQRGTFILSLSSSCLSRKRTRQGKSKGDMTSDWTLLQKRLDSSVPKKWTCITGMSSGSYFNLPNNSGTK